MQAHKGDQAMFRVLIIFLPLLVLGTSCLKSKVSKNKSKAHQQAVDALADDAAGVSNQGNEAPKVDVGPLRAANAEFYIDATSSGASSWHWEKLAGPGQLFIRTPDTEDTLVSADQDGFYWLRLTVTNGQGRTTYDDVQILWDTEAPLLNLTQEIRTFKEITVDAGVSSDAALIQWTQVTGPGTVSFSAPQSGKTAISASLDGTYRIRLTAVDKVGNVATGDLIFIWETTLPSASLGQDVVSRQEILLDGSGNRAVSYSWSQVSGPGTVIFASPEAEDTLVRATQDGTYVLRLTITAANGATAFDELNFTWDTEAPTIDLGQDLSKKFRASIDATTSGAISYKWSLVQGPGKVIFSSPESEDTALVVDQAGVYELQLSVSDLAGNLATDRVQITFDYDVRVFAQAVSSGGSHSCAILDDGTVSCWGYNFEQELGYGDENQYGEGRDRYLPPAFPIQLGNGKTAKALSVNYSHSCAVLNDGSVKCWGQNSFGQLGYGDTLKRGTPPTMGVELGMGLRALTVATGFAHTCVIREDGAVVCWGSNASGQLGYGDNKSRLQPSSQPINLGSGQRAKALQLGAYHSCALLENEQIKCWGDNSYGQTGQGAGQVHLAPPVSNVDFGPGLGVRELAAGSYHTCAVLSDSSARCWGRNQSGQLGYGDLDERRTPSLQPIDFGPAQGVSKITAGLSHTCAVMSDKAVQCWGGNEEGQLGYGDGLNHLAPIATPVPLQSDRPVAAIAAGRLHTCVIFDEATLKCWGSNTYGQLGTGKIVEGSTPPPAVIGFGD